MMMYQHIYVPHVHSVQLNMCTTLILLYQHMISVIVTWVFLIWVSLVIVPIVSGQPAGWELTVCLLLSSKLVL